MIKLFGKTLCSACQQQKKEFDAAGIHYEYYDLDTVHGMAEAAYRGILKDNMILPILIDEEDDIL